MKEKNHITKSIRLHKEYDKELIEVLNNLSKRRELSYKIKEILKKYFRDKDDETLKLLKQIKRKLDDGNVSAVKQSIETIEKHIENKSIADLMGNMLEESEEEEDLF